MFSTSLINYATLPAVLFGSSLSESEILNHAMDKQHRADQDKKHSGAAFQQRLESGKFKVEQFLYLKCNYRQNMFLNDALSHRNIVFKLTLDQ